ncbi:DUF3253 domain-containing protein [Variibacter gotjawalensis]|uniref:DUF3253 domain-containing protein n=2 Tax=Variibacter gotjawalensis TaxID=1333996 RepID=UPI000BBA7EEA
MELLERRAPMKTICPSEIARVLARPHSSDWPALMPLVHAAVDHLLERKLVRLSWRGMPIIKRDGPYRIARAQTDDPS